MILRTIPFRSLMHGLALLLLACSPLESTARSNPRKMHYDFEFEGSAEASIEKHWRWRKALPRCTLGKSWLREDWPESGEVGKLRGVLYPGEWNCTLMGCDFECCNRCGSTMEFLPRAEMFKHGARGKGRPIRLAGATYPLKLSAMDCALDSLSKLPLLEVVVSGQLDDEVKKTVVNAKICVLGELPQSTVRPPAER